MVQFTEWSEAFILILIFAVAIAVPCILSAFMGKRLIDELGFYPSKAPLIQMSILWQFIAVETVTFCVYLLIYNVLSS